MVQELMNWPWNHYFRIVKKMLNDDGRYRSTMDIDGVSSHESQNWYERERYVPKCGVLREEDLLG
jgi:hypothetical protein